MDHTAKRPAARAQWVVKSGIWQGSIGWVLKGRTPRKAQPGLHWWPLPALVPQRVLSVAAKLTVPSFG